MVVLLVWRLLLVALRALPSASVLLCAVSVPKASPQWHDVVGMVALQWRRRWSVLLVVGAMLVGNVLLAVAGRWWVWLAPAGCGKLPPAVTGC